MRRAIRRLAAASFALVAMLVATGLAPASGRAQPVEPLVVFAAASLSEVFEALEGPYHMSDPAPVRFQFAASSTLVVQIEAGALADVVATADERTMQRLARARRVVDPQLFARGELVIAVEPGNPHGIRGLADLARPDLVVVLAAPEVPAGRYAREVLRRAGIAVTPRSLEANVSAVLARVMLGEADAGLVYASDVVAAGDRAQGIPFPEAETLSVAYWVAPLADSRRAFAARQWIDLLLSEDGRAALRAAGFSPP